MIVRSTRHRRDGQCQWLQCSASGEVPMVLPTGPVYVCAQHADRIAWALYLWAEGATDPHVAYLLDPHGDLIAEDRTT